MKKSDIFRTLPAGLVKKEKGDAKKFKRNVSVVAQAAYQHFFALPELERGCIYATMPERAQGRRPA